MMHRFTITHRISVKGEGIFWRLKGIKPTKHESHTQHYPETNQIRPRSSKIFHNLLINIVKKAPNFKKHPNILPRQWNPENEICYNSQCNSTRFKGITSFSKHHLKAWLITHEKQTYPYQTISQSFIYTPLWCITMQWKAKMNMMYNNSLLLCGTTISSYKCFLDFSSSQFFF